MDMKPIETVYAGHRFRSRLEARWAVFFDTAGIKWEYEPQGYEVNGRAYLPDFRLPDLRAFVEVKGDPERLDIPLMVDLTSSYDGELFTLILGDIPVMELGKVPVHTLLMPNTEYWSGPKTKHYEMANRVFPLLEEKLDKEESAVVREFIRYEGRRGISCYQAFFLGGKDGGWSLIPFGGPRITASAEEMVEPGSVWPLLLQPDVKAAYAAARQARFEHGETPTTASSEG